MAMEDLKIAHLSLQFHITVHCCAHHIPSAVYNDIRVRVHRLLILMFIHVTMNCAVSLLSDVRNIRKRVVLFGKVSDNCVNHVMVCNPLNAVNIVVSVPYTGLFISPSGISELDCTTTKTDTAERSISIGGESLQVFFLLGALAYFQVPPLGGSREEKWRSQ